MDVYSGADYRASYCHKSQCSHLSELARIFVGVQTSNDKVYILTADSADNDYVYFHDKNGEHERLKRHTTQEYL